MGISASQPDKDPGPAARRNQQNGLSPGKAPLQLIRNPRDKTKII